MAEKKIDTKWNGNADVNSSTMISGNSAKRNRKPGVYIHSLPINRSLFFFLDLINVLVILSRIFYL